MALYYDHLNKSKFVPESCPHLHIQLFYLHFIWPIWYIECCTYTQTYPISARNSCSFLCPFVVHTLNLHTYIQVMIQTMTVTYVTLAITLVTTRGKHVCTESCKCIHTLRYLHAVYAEWQKLSYSVQCLYSNKRSLRWH